jgi:hypothetical protein
LLSMIHLDHVWRYLNNPIIRGIGVFERTTHEEEKEKKNEILEVQQVNPHTSSVDHFIPTFLQRPHLMPNVFTYNSLSSHLQGAQGHLTCRCRCVFQYATTAVPVTLSPFLQHRHVPMQVGRIGSHPTSNSLFGLLRLRSLERLPLKDSQYDDIPKASTGPSCCTATCLFRVIFVFI